MIKLINTYRDSHSIASQTRFDRSYLTMNHETGTLRTITDFSVWHPSKWTWPLNRVCTHFGQLKLITRGSRGLVPRWSEPHHHTLAVLGEIFWSPVPSPTGPRCALQGLVLNILWALAVSLWHPIWSKWPITVDQSLDPVVNWAKKI